MLISVWILGCKETSVTEPGHKPRPNIILILADDLGYGELGVYGQSKIETPNIDRLASEGIKFTQFYTGAPVCAPARAILLTGLHSGHAYVRGNDEWPERGDVWNYTAMFKDSTLEGQRPVPANTVMISKLLQQAGYTTGAVGKWGLGGPHTHGRPNAQGFDFFFGYNCQRQAHTYYPLHLYRNENRILLSNDTVAPRTKLPPDADPMRESSYSQFNLDTYSPELMAENVLGFVRESSQSDDPFFLYWATPLPHLPLQAPRSWVDYYRNKFGEEMPYVGDKGYFPARYPRATYAAMISYLDENVGKLVAALKEVGEYENTIILFTSDNGPTYTGGADTQWFDSGHPFSSEYGWGKGFLKEGGIRVPLIATWPGTILPGSTTDIIAASWDLFPTFCDLGGVPTPPELDGLSLLPTLVGDAVPNPILARPYLYWEFPEYNGQQAVRMGKWKAIRENLHDGNLQVALYDLSTDLEETVDVSAQYPEIVEQVTRIFQEEHQQAEVQRFRMAALGDSILVIE